ncbi:TPA: ribosome biogenesis GTPase Der [Patescibacteria group bacterium]|nr:ribosome biogenesis GTPase Der [Patescibacteria group bacterium]
MTDQPIQSNYIVAIVGRPNVGKSTLFNKIAGQNRAILSDIPGTTRDILYEQVTWNGFNFTIADTAGIDADYQAGLERDIFLQTQTAVQGADLIIFLVDARVGQQVEDRKAAELIRKLGKLVILAVNKAEGTRYDNAQHEFYTLGLGEPMLISAVSGRGVGDILDNIVVQLKKMKKKILKRVQDDKDIIRVAIIGRPNVGKSTLINQLAQKNLALVSDIPGTTRDIVRTTIPAADFNIEISDTAGLRRRGKIEKGIEKFSSLLVLRAVNEADIVLLVIDADEGILAQDLHIAQIIEEAGKGVILLINKWDVIEKNASVTSEYDKYLEHKFIFMPWLAKVYISALTGQRTDKIIQKIAEVWQALQTKIPSKELNNLIGNASAAIPPKGKRKNPKIYFASQISANPPTIKLKVNYPEELHFSYLRYLDKQLRQKYPMIGAPIRWQIIKSSSNSIETTK